MVLVTETMPHFQSLSIGIWVNAGTRHEISGEEGMSHFLEHMVFKGTKRRSALEIAQAVDRVGGEFNAFTTREYTCFHLLLLARDVSLASDIMTDVLLNSTFAEDEIEREIKVVLQEISMVEDNPEELVFDQFFEKAFGKHALGKPILGSPESVASFTREKVISYFRKHYSPSQMVISVAGDVEHEKVRRIFERNLGRAFKEKTSPLKANLNTPVFKPGVNMVNRDLEQSHVVIGFPGVAYDDQDRFAALLLNVYLGGGMSSSLFQEIREKRGLAYTIYSSLAPFSDTGLFSVYVGTSPKEVVTCLDVTGQEIAKLRDKKMSSEVLQILKDNLKGTILLNSDSVETRMMSIAKNEMFFGKYFSTGAITKHIEKVTPADVQRLAKKIFKKENLMLSALGPKLKPQVAQKLLKHLK